MTVRELTDRVQNIYSRGVQSDDSRLRRRLIYNKLMTAASKAYAKFMAEGGRADAWDRIAIPCISLQEASIHECECLPPAGKKFWRSVEKLPKALSKMTMTTLGGDQHFSIISWEEKKNKRFNKYTANKPAAWIRNGYLYLTGNPDKTPLITVEAVWEDPVAVQNFRAYCTDCGIKTDAPKCYSALDVEFPIPNRIEDNVIQDTLQELLGLFNRQRQDKKNNAEEDAIQQEA